MADNIDPNTLYICRALRCKGNGCDSLVEVLEKVLKTTIDKGQNNDEIKLETSLCMGHCSNGPNIKVNNKVYNHVDKQVLKRVLVVMKSKQNNQNTK
ncbi:MAG: NAD(P)H-dependent oxidoreductase subunit E [Candidatus Sericytochromatia bacterium]